MDGVIHRWTADSGAGGAVMFHTFGDAGADRVTPFSLAQGDWVLLDSGTQCTVNQVRADTVIRITGGGQMMRVNAQMSTLTAGRVYGV